MTLQGVVATIVVNLFIRGIGQKFNTVVGYGVSSALTLIGVVYFLSWYLDRHLPRPDGTPLGRGDAYRLAGVHALVMIVVTVLAYAAIAARQKGWMPLDPGIHGTCAVQGLVTCARCPFAGSQPSSF